jgi:hypothetical protein
LILAVCALPACSLDDRRPDVSTLIVDTSDASAASGDSGSAPSREMPVAQMVPEDLAPDANSPEPGALEPECGCRIGKLCVRSGESMLGTCLVCDPARSTDTFVPAAEGTPCGSAPAECSSQDTCDAVGVCLSNHLPSGTACGTGVDTTCDPADLCDAAGACTLRVAENGSSCEDGLFCTEGDGCVNGQCVSGPEMDCGSNARCDEGDDICECRDCQSGNNCIGTTNYHRDADIDGDGDPGDIIAACSVPEGYVENNVDCCPADATVSTRQTAFFPEASTLCNDNTWDYNCSGGFEFSIPECTGQCDVNLPPRCGCVATGTCNVIQCGTEVSYQVSRLTNPPPVYGGACQYVTLTATLRCR